MLRSKIREMLGNFCCSECKSDFNENAINIIRQEDGLCVVQIICPNCGKAFGIALLGISDLENKSNIDPFEIEQCPDAISYDDVIDAHKFIKELNDDWEKYIPEKYQKK